MGKPSAVLHNQALAVASAAFALAAALEVAFATASASVEASATHRVELVASLVTAAFACLGRKQKLGLPEAEPSAAWAVAASVVGPTH